MALCTQTQLEQRLQINFTDDSDVVAAELIAAAQGHIEAYVGRSLEAASRTETFDAPTTTIWLNVTPVNSITTVTVDGTALTASDYVFTEYGRLDRTSNSRVVSWGTHKLQSIEVVYDGGYGTGLVPYAIQDICAWSAARAFQTGAAYASVPAGAEGVKQVMLAGSDSVTYIDTAAAFAADNLTDQERRTLDFYRTPNLLP